MSLNFKTYITNKDITHFGYKTLSLLAVTGILDLLIDEVKTGYVTVYRQIHRLLDSILSCESMLAFALSTLLITKNYAGNVQY